MRIIDKNKDFYDYMQNIEKDDYFVWDRRNSYVIDRHSFVENIKMNQFLYSNIGYDNHLYLFLHVGYDFWIAETEINNDEVDYRWAWHWKDYSAECCLINFQLIKLSWESRRLIKKVVGNEKLGEFIMGCIKSKDYDCIIDYTANGTIPIMAYTLATRFVKADDVYHAFEEYFSHENTKAEQTVAGGTTNEMKIEAHGFDLKKSFRGKNK